MILTEVGGESLNLASHWHPEVGQFVSFLLIHTFHWKLREAPSPVRYALFTVFTTGVLSSRLEKKQTINSWKRHVLCDLALSNERNRWTRYRNSMRNEIWSIYNDKFCSILRSLTLAKKNSDREDFGGANCLRVDKGRNRRVQPWLCLITGIIVMAKQALNGRERRKPQRTHKMLVNSIDFTCKMFVFRAIYRCKSTKFKTKFSTVPLWI